MTTKKHEVPEELLSGLLANYKKPEDLIGEHGLLKQLTEPEVGELIDAAIVYNATTQYVAGHEVVLVLVKAWATEGATRRLLAAVPTIARVA